MHALVIGGNGFLGSSVVEGLLADGHRVRVLDRSPARPDVDWGRVDYRIGGLDDRATLQAVLEGVDCVYHLASSTVPGTSNQDPAFDVGSNLVGALNLIAEMADAGVRRIVFFSSGGTVYGNPERIPVDEAHPLRPISSYGVVKVAIENYLSMYQRLGQLDPLILRPSNPYGPRQSTSGIQGAVAAFLGRALNGEGVQIWGDGEVVRDYIYVDDLVDLAIRAGRTQVCGIYNAGSGVGCSLNELAAIVRDVTGRALPAAHLPGRAFDVSRIVLEIGAARRDFSWAPSTDLRDGIDRAWRALRQAQRNPEHG